MHKGKDCINKKHTYLQTSCEENRMLWLTDIWCIRSSAASRRLSGDTEVILEAGAKRTQLSPLMEFTRTFIVHRNSQQWRDIYRQLDTYKDIYIVITERRTSYHRPKVNGSVFNTSSTYFNILMYFHVIPHPWFLN